MEDYWNCMNSCTYLLSYLLTDTVHYVSGWR